METEVGIKISKQAAFNQKNYTKTEHLSLSTLLNIIVFALKILWKIGPFLLVSLSLTTILQGLVPTATVWVGKFVLNAVINTVQTSGSHVAVLALFYALGMQLIILIFAALIGNGNQYLTFLLAKRLSLDMNSKVLKKTSGLDMSFFDSPYFYNMITRARRESEGKPLLLVLKVNMVLRGAITFASMATLIAFLCVPLIGVMIILCLPILFIEVRYGEKHYLLQFMNTQDARMTAYLSGIMTAKEYIPEILSYGLWSHLFQKWFIVARKLVKKETQLQSRRILASASAGTISAIGIIGTTAYVVYLGIRLSLSAGEIMMYAAAFAGGLTALRGSVKGISGMYEDSMFLRDFITFNQIEPKIEIKQKRKLTPIYIESLELRNVSFKYPGTKRKVLKNINLLFQRSESTLVVGANGAGKTTLIKLLARLYDPSEGQILLNGTDIREYEIESLRQTMGIIFQEFGRYAFSAKENIGFGDIENLSLNEKIISAAKRAKAASFIERLPQKYDTILSRIFENGTELSLGQWQRVCLARLFMKDAPILIFDEPTASLDIETEAHLLGEIVQMSKDKICILISHRMFRKGLADRIVVIKAGAVVEIGTHESLIVDNGEYARLFNLYREVPIEKELAM